MNRCSFCGREEQPNLPLVEGIEGHICKECSDVVNESFEEIIGTETAPQHSFKRPHEIKEELDKYVIGQEEAKKILSVAVYNHYKRINMKSKVDIQKTNVMMIGPSGSGKTYLLQTLAKILDVPLMIADATSLTEAGYIGEDVESIIEKLVMKAGGDIAKAERGIVYIDEIDKLATAQTEGTGRIKDVGGQGVQEALLKIVEDSEVQVTVGGNVMNKKRVGVHTKNILFVCGGAFVGIDEMAKKRATNRTVKHVGFMTSELPQPKPSDFEVTQQDLVSYGFIPELVGRIPMIALLNPLTKEDLSHILTKPKNAILKQYQALFRADGVKLKFHQGAIEHIAEEAIKKKVGARGLKGVVEKKMYQLMFELPQMENVKSFTITKEMITGEESMIPKQSKA